MPDNTGKIQAKEKLGQFKKGASGNPEGRPKGSRNRAILAVQEMLEGEAEAITRNVIELAKAGDMAAIKLVLERIIPPRKDSPVCFEMPTITSAGDLVIALGAILHAVGNGDITPSEGQGLASMLEYMRRSIETQELERKIDHLESLIKARD